MDMQLVCGLEGQRARKDIDGDFAEYGVMEIIDSPM